MMASPASAGATTTPVSASLAQPPGPRPPGQTASPRAGLRTPVTPQLDRSTSSAALVLSQAAAAELERKRRLVRSVPLLVQLIKEQHCSEDDLLAALRLVPFADGEYIYRQGQTDKDLYFIEEGRVLLTQRRTMPPLGTVVAGVGTPRSSAPRRSLVDADLELQLHTHNALEYFGELSLLQDRPRKTNAIASGAVICMALSATDYATLLAPLHELLLYRHLLRAHCVLERQRLFKEFSPAQRQFLIDRVTLQRFAAGELICRQGENDDRFFILADGEANVVLNEVEVDQRSRTGSLLLPPPTVAVAAADPSSLPTIHERLEVAAAAAAAVVADGVELRRGERYGTTVRSTVVAQKSLFQGFGEMGLLDKPRTADVVAVGCVLCLVLTRRVYLAAAQMNSANGSSALDADAEEMLATTLIEEWNLVLNARNLHLSNPQVAHYLVTFIKKFKAAYNQKFVGRTMYLDLLRRVHQEPALGDEFEFLAARIAWDSPSSSLSIIRSETRRVLSLPPERRSAAETSFVARMIESTAFLAKFDVPAHVDRSKLARHLAKVSEFWHVTKDQPLFRQGKIESRAFLILRGRINIVNEDVTATATALSSGAVKHYEVIATLAAGDSFGELSLVTRLQRSATAMAACDADLLVLDRERLHLLQQVLPGVSVQHLMVERAEFLARLSFFKGSDFGQCIRVAHDLHEIAYEPRHLFLQEPVHQRTLYIVKSGEIAVFVKRQVGTPPRTGLVRVASIGAQEFFGVAIATVNVGQAPTAGAPPATPSALTLGTSWDLGTTVYMCTTRVVMLELSERGWRRLNATCLQIIRNVLLERHHWHDELATRQKEPTYLHPERPWLQLSSTFAAGAGCGPERLRAKQEAEAFAEAERQRQATAAKEMETRAQEIAAMWRPSTALFDDEGVLTAWLFTRSTPDKQPRLVVSRRDHLELNLLRLEARLQDLALSRGQSVVAVQWREPPLLLDEAALDHLIRTLCVRERALTSPDPDLAIDRTYGDGAFVLQAHTTARSETRVAAHFVGKSGSDRHEDEDVVTIRELSDAERPLDLPSAAQRGVESQTRAVVRHLASKGVAVLSLELEFTVLSSPSAAVLTSARSLVASLSPAAVQPPASSCHHPLQPRRAGRSVKGSQAQHQPEPDNPLAIAAELVGARALPSHHSYRICRKCRSTADVDLALEVQRHQATLRGVLAQYQSLQQGHSDLETQLRSLQQRLAQRDEQIESLTSHLDAARSAAREQRREQEESVARYAELERRLATLQQNNATLLVELDAANAKALERQQQHDAAVNDLQDDSTVERQRWQARHDDALRELEALRAQVARLELLHRRSEQRHEEMRAECDEMRFQWSFVSRKLTDVAERGVLPPRRVAGGFSSYPTPSAANVEHVVKWIVDYEARRTVIDSQKKSAGRRLRMKLQLMPQRASRRESAEAIT
ncbi:hypothetical protein ATCC90586_004339 [Pythium insidiosum]|nr:hypothetical protein ATCC90586_004339 [Pythium insidiosum]